MRLACWFALGSVAMRGAGCTWNDILDRDLDAQVARTRSRPLPSGQATPKQALAWTLAQCLVGLIVLLQLSRLAALVALGSILLVAAYPLMKRITWWPQAWLGLTFNWGALVGYAALGGDLATPAPWLLYLGGVFWTLGYDTIYALQDKEDDALAGVKSSAGPWGRMRVGAWRFLCCQRALHGGGVRIWGRLGGDCLPAAICRAPLLAGDTFVGG
ncbi:4-hydroxybenzoate octaprenyltransferase [Hankyongella ginsenosidimutans]|uniref:4-hydroxybenzoate octaprenyltransferase n=1 Tax=Hankyongella ginsenosidimutans TaxID=1763828 RepID=UPI001FEBCD31|nr:4-hydroxybenzoate octaprenyltransferase [Hankyongella ginsenosidimutans]